MALKLKGSTSGFVGLDAPSVAGNNTLILPNSAGSAHQILANDITAGVTTFTSVTISRNGDLTVPGTISIGGTLTYEDVTSVDSVGIVTARGLSIFGDTTGLSVSGITTITKGASGGAAANSDAALIIDNNSNNYIQLRSPNTTGQGILFGDDADNDIGSVAYNHNINSLAFTVNASERLRIDSNGKVGINQTNPGAFDKFVVQGTGNVIAAQASSGAAGIGFYESNTGRFFLKTLNGSDGLSFVDGDNSTERLRITADGHVNIPSDSTQLKLGAGQDLTIYHNGSQSYVANSTGNLNITSQGAVVIKTVVSEDAIVCNANGSVDLYHNGNRQVFTIDGGLNFQDNKKAEFGNSGDLKIFHDGTNSRINNVQGNLMLKDDVIEFVRQADDTISFRVYEGGSTDLYYNHNLRLKTWSDAVNIYGSEGQDAILHLYADEGDDNADKWRFLAGTAGQLDIANYSTGSWINHLIIDGSGRVRKPNHPSFRAGRSGSSLSVSGGDAIIFNETGSSFELHNQGGHYNTSTGKFTAPVDGVYYFHTQVIYQGLSDGDSMIDVFHMYVDNSHAGYSHKRGYYRNTYTGDGGYYTDTGSLNVKLTAGETVWVRQQMNSRTVHANPRYCIFEGFLVG